MLLYFPQEGLLTCPGGTAPGASPSIWWLRSPGSPAPPHHCATERSYSSFQKVLGVNLTKIFSCSVALASNRLSCFPPSIRTPNSLPGIENNLNKPVHPELGAGRLTLPLLLCPCQDKGLVTDSRRAGIPKNPRGPVVPSGSRSKESWGL